MTKKVVNLNRTNSQSPGLRRSSSKSGFSMAGSHDYSEEGKRTTLHFIMLDGKKETIELDRRPRTYWDLQEVIVKKKPHSRKMFAIRNEKKHLVTSKNYVPQDILYIQEFITSLNMKNHPLEECRWEFYKYHAKPEKFHDKMEERLLIKKAAELEAKLAREEEEKANAEFLKNKEKDVNEDLKDV